MDEQSIFLRALEQPAGEVRNRWLDDACGRDTALRLRIDALLAREAQAGSFLQNPPSGFEATIIHQAENDRAASLDAGLAPAFDGEAAVVIGGASVLRSIGKNLSEIPSVSLRESAAEGNEPIARPNSPEMPKGTSDSRYQLQGEIARGGMGAIIKGRDTDLGRDLAIKVLLDSHKDRPEVIQRFIEEAQIGGQLQHPGIAPVYELGQFKDKRPFFSMKLVKGETLSKLLSDRKDAAEERGKFIGIFEQVCQTMAYAHSRGVIHRDLKPANIMVGAFGEVQVMDWGLAKVLSSGGVADEKLAQSKHRDASIIQTLRSGIGSDAPAVGSLGSAGSHTLMGSVMGTPAYMPPEQALGEIDQLDQRADVFGLGAILCEILTGKPPYVGEDGTQVYRMASRGKLDDAFERLDNCGADTELVTLAKDCLSIELTERPKDAGVLAGRVTAYLESVEQKLRETELAKVDAQVRAEELRRRQRLAYTAGTAVVATLLIGISVSLWQMNRAINAETLARDEAERATTAETLARDEAERATTAETLARSEAERATSAQMLARSEAERAITAEKETAATLKQVAAERDEKERARRDADKARDEAEFRAYTSLVAAAAAHLQRNDSRTLRRLLEQAPERLRGWEWEYLWNESDRRLETTLTLPPRNEGYRMNLSSDGKLVAIRRDGASTEPVTVYDTRTGAQVASLNTYPSIALRMTFSGDNKYLAYQHFAIMGVQIYEIATGRSLVPNPHELSALLCFGPERAVVLDQQNKVRVFKISDWSEVAELPVTVHPRLRGGPAVMNGAHAGAISPDGKLLVINFAVRDDEQAPDPSINERNTQGDVPNKTHVFDLTTNAMVQEVEVWASAFKFSDSGDSLTVLSAEGDLATYSMPDWKKWPHDRKVGNRTNFTMHQLDEDQLLKSFTGFDSRLLWILVGESGEVALSDALGLRSAILRGHGSPGTSIAVDGEQTEIVTAHRDGTVCRWDLRQPFQMQIEAGGGVSPSVAFAPDGEAVYVGTRGRPVQVWEINAATGRSQGMLGWRPATPRHGSHATQLAFSPDGRRLAVATDSHWGFSRWLVYDLWTGLAQHTESNAEIGDVRCVDWSPDGKWIAVGGKTYGNNDGFFRIYDAGTYQASARLEGGAGGVHAVSFSRDSQRVVTAAEDGTLRIWDVSAGALLHTLGKPGDPALKCAVHSPEGDILVSGSADGTITAWNPQDGEQVFQARIHGAGVNSLAFTPDGRRLMTVSDDGSLRVLDPSTWSELLTLYLSEPARAMSFSSDGRRLALLEGLTNRLVVLEVESEVERSSLRRRRQACETEAETILQTVLKETTDPVEVRTRIIDGTGANQTLREAALEKLRQWLGNRWFAAYLLQTTDSLKRQILRQRLVFSADQEPSEALRQQLIAGMDAIQRQALSDVANMGGVSESFLIKVEFEKLVQGNIRDKPLDTREFAWEIVSDPARNSDDQLLACFGMQPVVRAYPQSASSLITMAWAEYRVGLYGNALDSAERAAAMSQDASVSARCLAVIGMCQHQMGQTEAGISTRERLIEVMKQPGDRDPTTVALADEAQKVLADPVETLWDEQAALSALTTRAEKVLGPKRTAILLASFAEQKSRRFLEQGDLEAAEISHQTARTLLEEQLTAANAGSDMAPDLNEVARALSELLLAKDESNPWSVLKPLEMKSQGGATLTLLEDGSVLASGTNPDQDTYTLVVRPELTRIRAIRLEALPDPSFKDGGSGRSESSGSFHVNEIKVFSEAGSVTLTNAVASFQEPNPDGHEIREAIDGKIDGSRGWSVYGRQTQPNWLIASLELDRLANDELKIELHCSTGKWLKENLGRFRLSVSDHPNAYAYASVMEPDDPFERLAVAYHLIGDEEGLSNLVEHHPQVATAIGNLYAKGENWQRAIEEYSKWITDQPADVTLLTKRAAAYIATEQWALAKVDWQHAVELQPELAQTAFDVFRLLQRWSEATVFGSLLLKQNPEDSLLWVQIAPIIALADDDVAYRNFCQGVVESYRKNPTGLVAERAIKSCLLRPGAIDVAELPGELLTQSLNDGTMSEGLRIWGWGSLAMLAYRSGDAEAAVKHVTQSEQLKPADDHIHAINFALLALAQQQLKHPDEAIKALDEASQVIQRRQAIDKNHHDLLITEILFREAEAKMNATGQGPSK